MNDTVHHTIRYGDWATMSAEAKLIRTEVFVEEQGGPAELEMDNMDVLCLHAVAYDAAGVPIGTGRLLPDGHIGRMAVRKSGRGTGVGSSSTLTAPVASRSTRVTDFVWFRSPKENARGDPE